MGRPLPTGPLPTSATSSRTQATLAVDRPFARAQVDPSPPESAARTATELDAEPVSSPLYGLAPELAAMLRSSGAVSPPSSDPQQQQQQQQHLDAVASQSNGAAIRALDARLDEAIGADHTGSEGETGPTATVTTTTTFPADRLDARRMLDQVRQRLDETRQRIASTAQAMRREAGRSDGEAETVDTIQSNLNRDIRFASRVDILANTLNSIAERTLGLSSAIEGLRVSPPPPPHSPNSPAAVSSLSASPSFPTALDSAVSPAPSSPPLSPTREAQNNQTEEIRAVVQQLILMSRRVSAVIAQHREQVGTSPANLPPPAEARRGSSSTLSMPAGSSRSPPPPNPHDSLPVILPTYLQERAPPPNTSLNTDGLLLPRPSVLEGTSPAVFSTSPQPMWPATSPEPGPSSISRRLSPSDEGHATGADDEDVGIRESYPGERAQLMRIAQLQSDIAQRAGELRALRARGDELDRERRQQRLEREERRRTASALEQQQQQQQQSPAARRSGTIVAPLLSTLARSGSGEAEAEKDEDEVALSMLYGLLPDRSDLPAPPTVRRQSEIHGWSRAAHRGEPSGPSTPIKVAVDTIRRKQEYEAWRQCGR